VVGGSTSMYVCNTREGCGQGSRGADVKLGRPGVRIRFGSHTGKLDSSI
jgi:hypothetical protein